MDAKKNKPAALSLPSDREILVTRAFQAPTTAVFDAWSKAEHLQRWFACAGLTMPICEVDFREGGKWRRVLRDAAQGMDHATSGEFREITRPDRLVFTEVYEPIPGSDHLVTLTFQEHAGGTLFTQRFLHQSKEARDAHLRSGMENGLEATFARLDELLSSPAVSPAAEDARP